MAARRRFTLKLILRMLAIGFLVYQLVRYSVEVLSRAKKGRVVMTAKEIPTDAFEFPTIAICFKQEYNKEVDTFDPIAFARHYLMVNSTYGQEKLHMKRFVAVAPHDTYDDEFGIDPAQLWRRVPESFRRSIPCLYYTPPQDFYTPTGFRRMLTIGLDSSHLERGFKSLGYQITLSRMKWILFWQMYGATRLQLQGRRDKEETRVLHLPITFAEKTSLYTEEKPCTELRKSEDFFNPPIINQCLFKYYSEHVPCFMNASTCTEKDVKRMNHFRGLINELKYEELTGCAFPCTMENFKVTIAADLPMNRSLAFLEFGRFWMDDALLTEFLRADLILNFYVARPYKLQEEEYYVYDGPAALGDIGGMLGLLLGASILTLLDFILDQSCRAWDWCKKRQRDRNNKVKKKYPIQPYP